MWENEDRVDHVVKQDWREGFYISFGRKGD